MIEGSEPNFVGSLPLVLRDATRVGGTMLVRAGPVIAAACLTIGCYNYLPVGRSHLAPATDLAITLTETGSVELERYLGRDVHVVRGHYLRDRKSTRLNSS